MSKSLQILFYLILPIVGYSQEINISQHIDGEKHIKTEIKNNRTYYHQIWDVDGKEELINGTGIHSFFDEERNITDFRSIKDSLCITWYEIRNEQSDTVYWISDSPAVYKKGIEEFYLDVQLNIRRVCDPFKIDEIKKNTDVQTQVFIHFVVNKKGKISEVTVNKANNKYILQCSESIVRALKGWIPAKSNNKAVDFQFVLPLKF